MRRVLLTLFAIFAAGFLGAGWYVYHKGFTKSWRLTVSEEFRKRGVEVYLRKLTIDPMRGLVAEGVKVLDAKNRKRTLAEIDAVILQVNYANLIRGETFLDALELRDANLTLPLDSKDPDSPKVAISKLNARLFMPPHQFYLAKADAEVFGIRITAAGRLINADDFKSPEAEDGEKNTALLARVIAELGQLRFEASPPALSVTFAGDLSERDQLTVDVAFWGERIRRGGYLLGSLYIGGGYRNGIVQLTQLVAADHSGALHLSGRFDPRDASFDARLKSGIDAQGLARAFHLVPAKLDELLFYAAPSIELSASGSFGDEPKLEVLGHFAAGKFAYQSVVFDRFAADFSWDGERWSARDVRLAHRTGEVRADVICLPGEFRARVHSAINPLAFVPLLPAKARPIAARFEFPDAPRLDFEVSGREPSFDACTFAGTLALGATSYRGAACKSLATGVRFADRVLTIAPFRVVREEGEGRGGLVFDFKRDEVRLEKIVADVNPPEVMRWIDMDLVKDVAPYRFKRPPNLKVDGTVHMKHGPTTSLTIDIDAPKGMDYTFLKKNLSALPLSGKLHFGPERMKISALKGSLLGGRLTGDADISTVRGRPGHRVSLQVEDMDFAALTRLYFEYDDSQGRLNARYEFTGRGDDARTMQGRGELTVTDGNVFAIPFLGPLSGILNTIVPGMGYNVARKGSASFTINDGVIETDDLVVEGKGFSMIGRGKLFFIDDRMDFDMRINAQGLPGVLLFPVSKLLEYTSDQKLSKPTWRSKVVPRL
jgi:AsmA-like C-terminal region